MADLRIERIDFSPWGCFEDLSLTFSSKAGEVDLIHGPNAAGKSTTSRGERSLLYGIEARTPDNHTYDYTDLRIGARLQLNGASVELSRRKRRVGSLVGPDGEALNDDPIAAALGGLTEEVYRTLFQVDHETLVQGGAELLQGRGEIGASLFAAAAGIASLHDTLAQFDGEADQIFSSRGRATVLHRALNELRDAEKRLREAMLRPARHREMTRALENSEKASEELSDRMRDLDLRARAIERKRAIAPLLDGHAERVAELEHLAGTPDLPDTTATERSVAQGRARAGATQLKRAQDTVSKLDDEIEAIAVDDAIVSRAQEIQTLKESISVICKAAGDRRKREGELQEARAGLKTAAAIVGIEPDEIDGLRRPATARRALDHCLSEHGELASRLASAQARTREAKAERSEALSAHESAPRGADVRDLEASITTALKAGTLSERIEAHRLDAELKRAEAIERLTRLTPAPPSIAALRTLPAPAREQAKRAAEERDDLKRAADALEADARRLAVADAELAEEQDHLTLAGEAPTADTLADARELRDGQWSAIRTHAVGGSPTTAEDAERFERSLGAADHLADARISSAAQIERTATIHARAKRLERDRADLIAREAELSDRNARISDEWETTWCETGLPAVLPRDASSWLDERDAILDLERAAAQAETQLTALDARERTLIDALATQLHGLGHEVAMGVGLDTTIARAQAVIDEARRLAMDRAGLKTTLTSAERALIAAERDQSLATTALAGWEATWPQRRADAGLPATASPDAAQEIVRAVDDGLGHARRIADLERRIAGIDGDHSEFDARVRSLCEGLAPELVALDAEPALVALHTHLAEHQLREARREDLIERQSIAQGEVAAIENDIAAAQTELEALLSAANCEHADELPQIETKAARARALRREIAEIEQQVAQVGDGRFSQLADGVTDFDRERAVLDIEELQEQADELRQERDQLKEQLGESKRALGEAETNTAAVQAAQDVELARARVQRAAIAHAKAKLSAAVVRRAIDRYRRLHQDPLLRRANDLFGRFTLASFVELFVDVDDRGQAVLIGRQRDRVLKRVPEMSKGTREQLFLALRIAAIERYVATSGPVPVIFDDVFIESDEPRSERIFGAIGELATKTQVIVLTHHHHLIEVGRRALMDKLVVQDLPDAAPTLREAAAA
ncbi:MAG: AAA family ATPase [Solirubrobacteraceae bacterium]